MSSEDFRQWRQCDSRTKPVTVRLPDGTECETTLRCVGRGGSKKAYTLTEVPEFVRMLGNCDVQNPSGYWTQMVQQEVGVSKRLETLGLLCPRHRATVVTFRPSSDNGTETEPISNPAYLSDSFECLALRRNMFVIDTKESNSTTWKGGIFPDERSMDEDLETWRCLLKTFIEHDLPIMYRNSFPRGGDAVNWAIVGQGTDNGKSFEARLYAFDFASKQGQCVELETCEITEAKTKDYDVYRCRHLIRLIEAVMFEEFEHWGQHKWALPDGKVRAIVNALCPELASLSEDDMSPGCIVC